MNINTIYHGEALSVLKTFPDESIDCVMTSPPYWGLRSYQTATWEGGLDTCSHTEAKLPSRYDYVLSENSIQNGEGGTDAPRLADICPSCGAKKIDLQLGLEPDFNDYIAKLCDIFDEIKRVLKPEGTCWVNLGDTYYTRSGGAFENDTLSNKNKEEVTQSTGINIANQIRGRGLLPEKCLVQIPARFSLEMVKRGWILRNSIVWYKRNCMPSSIIDRFTVDYELIFFFVKQRHYYFEQQLEPLSLATIKDFNARKNMRWTTGENSKHHGREESGDKNRENRTRDEFVNFKGRNKRCVWDITPKPFEAAHFAVYPEELCETPIKAGCPNGGIVLDPFFGSGTTGLVALKQNKKFVGIELSKAYIEISNRRLEGWLNQSHLNQY